jgi:hypothetical protein
MAPNVCSRGQSGLGRADPKRTFVGQMKLAGHVIIVEGFIGLPDQSQSYEISDFFDD